jgi:CubicO group peptidase (beta-lactamase class C family)
MKKFTAYFLITLVLCGLWGALRFTMLFEGWLLTPWAEHQDYHTFSKRLKSEVDRNFKGNAVYAIIEDGEIVSKHFVSKGNPVNDESVFGVASIGKLVTSIAVLRLVEKGVLDLDTPVSEYTESWTLPYSEFNDQVTLRRLLSHTAGIEDGLGHNGFPQGQPIQPLIEHLTLAADADPGVHARVIVTNKPGESWSYSGGSYNLVQLIIEDVTQSSFQNALRDLVFEPLELENTYFQVRPDDPLLADYFGEGMKLAEYPNYTSLAATGLYTNLQDMHKIILASLFNQPNKTSSYDFLNQESLEVMRTPEAYVSGQAIWAAGPMLFAPTEDGFIVGHGGKSPYLNATVRFDQSNGDGFIMFQTGNEEAFSSDMATQWTLWKTGKPDIYLVRNRIELVIRDTLFGSILISLIVIVFAIAKVKFEKKRRVK